jgi:hypothetical protein
VRGLNPRPLAQKESIQSTVPYRSPILNKDGCEKMAVTKKLIIDRNLQITAYCNVQITVYPIDLVSIDQQSVGKRSFHLMDTVNAIKEMVNHLLACQQFFEKEPHSDRPCKRATIHFDN